MRIYLIEFNGDLPVLRPELNSFRAFDSLESALISLVSIFIGYVPIPRPMGQSGPVEIEKELNQERLPDPEDDRVVVWEADTFTHEVKAVWAFCGWHWSIEELGLTEQGKLPGWEKSLYELTMEE